ncbi:uroporphyrinogen-III synthase [Paucibacter sp. R3-3]|uniref:Uroporphyrinogen-III synthase n=1 Tax=Roseateles agri TaxID=3098619 RepID=A0ABU5DND7_9BURK|nr:uroporphyrinogen-III synthase [Paucibacter sp. R3-3]MDY0747195.1 uroporphyrinogen-III synthase [Paucibacter sp. R3-3]
MEAGTLVLTRPRQQAGEWIERLAAQGLAARSLPLIDVTAADGGDAAKAWSSLPGAALAVFVSPNAVEHFFAHRSAGASWPAGTLAACVGPGSARALREAGVPAGAIVQPPADAPSLDSEHLWPQLADLDWQGRQVLLLRGNGGREWLAERLRERGATATPFSVYRRGPPRFDVQEQALFEAILAAPRDYVWLFSSAEGVGHLGDLAPAAADWSQGACICTHERIAAAARGLGFTAVASARPDAAAVAQAFRALQKGDLQSFSP